MKIFLKTLIYLAVFFAVSGGVAFVTMRFLVSTGDTVIVPDLMDRDVVYTLETLTGLSLNINLEGIEYSLVVPKNRVLYQKPVPGRKIKKGRSVKIILSAGPRQVIIPDLSGNDIRSAKMALEDQGLALGWVSRAYVKQTRKDTVLSQFPASGNTVNKGRTVDLLVSRGPPRKAIATPRFIHTHVDDAISAAKEAGLEVSVIHGQTRYDIPPDFIIEQKPRIGYPAYEGDEVRLYVNRETAMAVTRPGPQGPRLVRYRVPPGFLQSKIRLRLDAFGLREDIHDDFARPGEELWFILPGEDYATVHLFRDDKPVDLTKLWIDRLIEQAFEKAFPEKFHLTTPKPSLEGEPHSEAHRAIDPVG